MENVALYSVYLYISEEKGVLGCPCDGAAPAAELEVINTLKRPLLESDRCHLDGFTVALCDWSWSQ